MKSEAQPFWESPLELLSRIQWESLCDGCAKCCLHKLEDEHTAETYFTNVACRLLDIDSCRCTQYAQRSDLVPDCLVLTPENIRGADLPATCAYRLLAEGKCLPRWHPLLSGDRASVHESGNSVLGRVVAETEAGDLEQHLLGVDGF